MPGGGGEERRWGGHRTKGLPPAGQAALHSAALQVPLSVGPLTPCRQTRGLDSTENRLDNYSVSPAPPHPTSPVGCSEAGRERQREGSIGLEPGVGCGVDRGQVKEKNQPQQARILTPPPATTIASHQTWTSSAAKSKLAQGRGRPANTHPHIFKSNPHSRGAHCVPGCVLD